jgi:hypothetical protein
MNTISLHAPLANLSASDSFVVIFAPLLFILGAMVVVYAKNYKNRQLQHETIRLMLEKGQPVPPELFLEKQEPRKKHNDFRSGLLWMAVSVGWYVCFAVMSTIMLAAMEKADATYAANAEKAMGHPPFPSYTAADQSWTIFSGNLHLNATSATQWFAIIPATIGLALLINAWVERKENKNSHSGDTKQ